jgi:activator of HSP90 ATPase
MNSNATRRTQATRRDAIFAATAVCGGLIFQSTRSWAQPEGEISRTQESIHQETIFKADLKRIYEALMSTRQFDQITQLGAAMKTMTLGSKPTEISPEVGGAFTLFGGYITGRHVELVPNERIVQAWRAGSWDSGVYSIVKFGLVPQGSGTKLIFDHTGFPKGRAEHLAAGWKENYWEPMQKFLG